MRFKVRLTNAALQEIQDRNPDASDVRALLEEPARLRSLVFYTDRLRLEKTLKPVDDLKNTGTLSAFFTGWLRKVNYCW